MELCVVLVNWRNARQTADGVRALRQWLLVKPRIVVVDNENSEGSRTALSEVLAADELISNDANLGYGGGNNAGIARALEAGARYILLLNSDTDLSETGARDLIGRLEAHPDISILGPILYERHNGTRVCCVGGRDIARTTTTRIIANEDRLVELDDFPLIDVDYVPGAVFLARSSVFTEIGQFDERFFFGGEVADFCKRAQAIGHRTCIDLQVSARHDRDGALDVRETLYAYYSVRNRLLYARKHHRAQMPKHLLYWTGVSLRSAAGALLRRRPDRARAILLALAHGYANRSGNQNAAFL